ncbi:hypothetical protein PR003_g19484 [Phytophthora rubi]|uniref:Uncharacterized protein n=1 Tax=Phytophthora rubi TaxID=129364 RepID=A0A6A4DSF3_9STRA|nr:hypothetical protein PR003_g19484 [Phytophthora rubi]
MKLCAPPGTMAQLSWKGAAVELGGGYRLSATERVCHWLCALAKLFCTHFRQSYRAGGGAMGHGH